MTSLNQFGRMAVAAAALSLLCDSGYAWNIGKAWKQLADATHDVVTLGEHGRDRDRERAEAQRKQAEQAAAAAEQQRLLQIDVLTKEVALLHDVTRAFESSLLTVKDISDVQGEISQAASEEVTKRAQALSLFERVRDWTRGNGNDLAQVLESLNSVSMLSDADLNAAFGPSSSTASLESLKAKQEVVAQTLKAKVEVVQKSGQTADAYLAQAIGRITTEGLTTIIGLAQKSRLRLNSLADSLESSRRTYRGKLSAQLDALVALKAGDRATLAANWEKDLQPESSAGKLAAAAQGVVNDFHLVEGVAKASTAMVVAPAIVQAPAPAPAPARKKICLSFGMGCFEIYPK